MNTGTTTRTSQQQQQTTKVRCMRNCGFTLLVFSMHLTTSLLVAVSLCQQVDCSKPAAGFSFGLSSFDIRFCVFRYMFQLSAQRSWLCGVLLLRFLASTVSVIGLNG